jgi:hypothetical protein
VSEKVMCDDGMRSGCVRLARVWITTASGELPMCDHHALFYLRKGRDIYPARPVEGQARPPVTVR